MERVNEDYHTDLLIKSQVGYLNTLLMRKAELEYKLGTSIFYTDDGRLCYFGEDLRIPMEQVKVELENARKTLDRLIESK